jgi:hypothetical protein
MIKKFYQFLIIFSLVIIPLTNAWAIDGKSIRYGLTAAGTGSGSLKSPGATPSATLAGEAGRIVGTILSFLGIIFLVLMIAGGIMWMTAGGSDAKVQKARSLIVAAVIGLIVVLSAYAITTFVADNLLAK